MSCEDAPCKLCQGRVCTIAALRLLEMFKTAERRERRIVRARRGRVSNLIQFPKRTYTADGGLAVRRAT